MSAESNLSSGKCILQLLFTLPYYYSDYCYYDYHNWYFVFCLNAYFMYTQELAFFLQREADPNLTLYT